MDAEKQTDIGVEEWSTSRANAPTMEQSSGDTSTSQKGQMGRIRSFQRAIKIAWRIVQLAPRSQKLFVVLVVIQMIFLCAERFTELGCVYHDYNQSIAAGVSQDEAEQQYHLLDEVWLTGLVAVTALFNAYFALEAVITANTFELGSFVITSILLALRTALTELTTNRTCGTEGLAYALLAIALLFNLSYWILISRMYKALQWKVYMSLGADPITRRMYRLYEAFNSVRKLDISFSMLIIMSCLIFLLNDKQDTGPALAVVICIFFTELLWDYFGIMGVDRQDPWQIYMFWLLSLFMPVFVITVSFETAAGSRFFNDFKQDPDGKLMPLRIGKLLSLGVLACLIRIFTVLFSVFLYKRFHTKSYQALQSLIDEGISKYERYCSAQVRMAQQRSHVRENVGGAVVELIDVETKAQRERERYQNEIAPGDALTQGEGDDADSSALAEFYRTQRPKSFVVHDDVSSQQFDDVRLPESTQYRVSSSAQTNHGSPRRCETNLANGSDSPRSGVVSVMNPITSQSDLAPSTSSSVAQAPGSYYSSNAQIQAQPGRRGSNHHTSTPSQQNRTRHETTQAVLDVGHSEKSETSSVPMRVSAHTSPSAHSAHGPRSTVSINSQSSSNSRRNRNREGLSSHQRKRQLSNEKLLAQLEAQYSK